MTRVTCEKIWGLYQRELYLDGWGDCDGNAKRNCLIYVVNISPASNADTFGIIMMDIRINNIFVINALQLSIQITISTPF